MKKRTDGKVWSGSSSISGKYLNESSWNGKMTWSIQLIQSFYLENPHFLQLTNKQMYHQSNEYPIVYRCVLPKDYYSFFVDLMPKCAISSNDSAHLCCVRVPRVLISVRPVLSARTRQNKKQNLRISKQNNSNESQMLFSQNLKKCIAMHRNFGNPKKFSTCKMKWNEVTMT